MSELETLIAVSRAKPRERRLCCPDCGGDIRLFDGRLFCQAADLLDDHGPPSFATLAELVVPGEDCPF